MRMNPIFLIRFGWSYLAAQRLSLQVMSIHARDSLCPFIDGGSDNLFIFTLSAYNDIPRICRNETENHNIHLYVELAMNWSAILSPQKLHRISFMRSKALTYMYLLFTIFQLAIHSFHCFYYSTMKEPLFSRFWLWRSVWIAFHSNERSNAAFFFFFHPWIARMAHVQNANTQWTYMRFSLVVFFFIYILLLYIVLNELLTLSFFFRHAFLYVE